MTTPNFFIIGAPKCGTTTLADWLAEHPHVYMSPKKEPHYYNPDVAGIWATTESEYRQLFQDVRPGTKAVGEGSTWYLISKVAVPQILSEQPDARFIVCLRNPVDMAFSLYGHNRVNCVEQHKSFEQAWDAQGDRACGHQIPRLCKHPESLMYGEVCAIGHQVERLHQHCDASHVLYVFMEDVKADPQAEYKRVLNFLGVETDHDIEFSVSNAATQNRSRLVAQSVKGALQLKQKLGLPAFGTGFGQWVRKTNRRPRNRSEMSDTMRSKLARHFHEDITLLERHTGRDLTHWR